MQSKPWLSDVPWDALVAINHSLCESQKVPAQAGKNQRKARQVWEDAYNKSMGLDAAFDVCRTCTSLTPFSFNNGNTFATVSRRIVDDWIESLPSYEAHMLRTTIGHYVNGMVSKKELLDTLKHAEITSKRAAPRGAVNP